MNVSRDATRVLARCVEAVRQVAAVRAFYAGGSLATGDFHEGVSDFDLVALIGAPLDERQQERLQSIHQRLIADEQLAAKLHCVYVPLPELKDLATAHVTWAHGELYRRPFGGVARAELLEFGLTLFGPPPAVLLPSVSRDALKQAVRDELAGYWTDALAKPHLWLQEVYVDLGLLILPRAEATLSHGQLITKSEALPRLANFGVATELVNEIARRREGRLVPVSFGSRERRAEHARLVVQRGIRRLLSQ
jgi:hypothetical protein